LGVHVSVKKRARQNKKANLMNKVLKSKIKTAKSKIEKAISSNNVLNLEVLYRNYVSTVDRAASRNVLRKNNISRKKSRMANKVNNALALSKS